MREYNKSILKYRDVRDAVGLAREEGRDEGRQEGRDEGRDEGRLAEKIIIIQKCIHKDMSIDDIIYLTGFSKEEINRYITN